MVNIKKNINVQINVYFILEQKVNLTMSKNPPSNVGRQRSSTITFKYQEQLPRLPIPDLTHTIEFYLEIIEPLTQEVIPELIEQDTKDGDS